MGVLVDDFIFFFAKKKIEIFTIFIARALEKVLTNFCGQVLKIVNWGSYQGVHESFQKSRGGLSGTPPWEGRLDYMNPPNMTPS